MKAFLLMIFGVAPIPSLVWSNELLLPDSRIVVVNCDSQENWGWSSGFQRSCRVPLANTTTRPEFHGSKVKLIWRVSLDGKKKESEAYKILGILSKHPAQTKGTQK